MNRSGIVMEVQNNKVCLMTDNGEFVNIKCKGQKPLIGQIYSGEQIALIPNYKLPILAASIAIMIFFSNIAYAYYRPVASIMVKINPYIELKINKWNRIIKVIPLNKDGNVLISAINLQNKTLEQGLNTLMDEATKENFLNNDYITSGKEINISVINKRNVTKIDFSKFIDYATHKNIKVKVNLNNSSDSKFNNENTQDNINAENNYNEQNINSESTENSQGTDNSINKNNTDNTISNTTDNAE